MEKSACAQAQENNTKRKLHQNQSLKSRSQFIWAPGSFSLMSFVLCLSSFLLSLFLHLPHVSFDLGLVLVEVGNEFSCYVHFRIHVNELACSAVHHQEIQAVFL